MIQPKIQIRAAVDCGASLTKAVCEINQGGDRSIEFYKLSPATRILTPGFVATAMNYVDDNTCVVEYGEDRWLVGANAEESTEQTYVGMKKSPTTIAKVMAFVGNIIRLYPECNIELTLGVMLPLSEFEDAEEIGAVLFKSLLDFRINREQVGVLLTHDIQVLPEYSGIACILPRSPVVLLGFGHRDVTRAYVENGTIHLSKSKTLAGYGMVRLLSSLPMSFSYEYKASHAIYNYLVTGNEQYLRKLRDVDGKLKGAIHDAHTQLIYEIASQVSDIVTLVDFYSLCGGNSAIFGKISQHIPGPKLLKPTKIIAEMREVFPELKRSPMVNRGLDVYCQWKSLPEVAYV